MSVFVASSNEPTVITSVHMSPPFLEPSGAFGHRAARRGGWPRKRVPEVRAAHRTGDDVWHRSGDPGVRSAKDGPIEPSPPGASQTP